MLTWFFKRLCSSMRVRRQADEYDGGSLLSSMRCEWNAPAQVSSTVFLAKVVWLR